MWYDLVRMNCSVRTSAAMALGVPGPLRKITDSVNLIEAQEMVDPKAMPKLEVRRMKIGTGFMVFVTWPAGQTEQISGFRDEVSALDWIKTGSVGWVAKHPLARRHRPT